MQIRGVSSIFLVKVEVNMELQLLAPSAEIAEIEQT